jgi:hypothetical protein
MVGKVYGSHDLQRLTSLLAPVKFRFFREIETSSERILGPVLERYAKVYARAILIYGSSVRIFILVDAFGCVWGAFRTVSAVSNPAGKASGRKHDINLIDVRFEHCRRRVL